jgi:hypothetical protein
MLPESSRAAGRERPAYGFPENPADLDRTVDRHHTTGIGQRLNAQRSRVQRSTF